MEKIDNTLYHYKSDDFVNTGYILGLDLDWTIIRPKYGIFPNIKKEIKYKILNPKSIDVKMLDDYDIKELPYRFYYLLELQKKGYSIVIFTNQKVSKFNNIESKISRLNIFIKYIEYYEIKVEVFMATGDDNYRKPNTGMWDYFINNNKVISAVYSGDAAGRYTDFSMSDIQFSMNCNIGFQLPEQLFHLYKPNIELHNKIYVLFGSNATSQFMEIYSNKYLYQLVVNPEQIYNSKSFIIITNSTNPIINNYDNYTIDYIYFTGVDHRYDKKIINSYMKSVILPKDYNEVSNVMFI